MPRKAADKKQKEQPEEQLKLVKKEPSFWDYFRFGESYTSLILGVIVVIIATGMLLSFVHNKNAGNTNTPINQQTQNTIQLSQQAQTLAQHAPVTPNDGNVSSTTTETVAPTAIPTPTAKPKPTVKPTSHPKPTARPVAKPTIRPTVKPTEAAKPTTKPQPTVTPKPKVNHVEVAKAKPSATKEPAKKIVAKKHVVSKKVVHNNNANKNVWVVQKGDSLWTIAQKKYTSGYNWVDIARANNLSNPSDIHVGDKLILPAVTAKVSTIATNNIKNTKATKSMKANNSNVKKSYTSVDGAISGNSYTVVHGDNLWNIAVRAYGDGFRWVDIARANNLANPRVIHNGNVLIIPRQ